MSEDTLDLFRKTVLHVDLVIRLNIQLPGQCETILMKQQQNTKALSKFYVSAFQSVYFHRTLRYSHYISDSNNRLVSRMSKLFRKVYLGRSQNSLN